MDIATAAQVLDTHTETLLRILGGYRNALASLRREVATDRALTAEGRDASYARQVASVQAEYGSQLAALRSQVDQADRAIKAAVAACTPAPQAGLEAQNARYAYWGRSRQLLDAGVVQTGDLISEASTPEELASLREELPAYTRVKGGRQDAVDGVLAAVQLRYVRLAPAARAAAGEEAMRAGTKLDGAHIRLDAAQAEVSRAASGGDMTAAIHAAAADQHATATLSRLDARRGDPSRQVRL